MKFLLILFSFIAACAHNPQQKSVAIEKFELMGPPEPTALEICQKEILRYDKMGEKERKQYLKQKDFKWEIENKLYFYGATHSRDPHHKQIGDIFENWNRFQPEFGVFEGQDEKVEKSIAATVMKHGEPGLIRYLAKRDKIPAKFGEPTSKIKINYLKRMFEPRQVEMFYFMRTAQHLRDRRNFSRDQIENFFHQVFFPLLKKRQVEFELSDLKQVESEYRRYWAEPKNWHEAPKDWFGPIKKSVETGGVFTNEVNAEESHFRNIYLYRTIGKQLVNNKKVFALFGGHHIPVVKPALQCLITALAEDESMVSRL